jgi:hypothetical protein
MGVPTKGTPCKTEKQKLGWAKQGQPASLTSTIFGLKVTVDGTLGWIKMPKLQHKQGCV